MISVSLHLPRFIFWWRILLAVALEMVQWMAELKWRWCWAYWTLLDIWKGFNTFVKTKMQTRWCNAWHQLSRNRKYKIKKLISKTALPSINWFLAAKTSCEHTTWHVIMNPAAFLGKTHLPLNTLLCLWLACLDIVSLTLSNLNQSHS